MTDIQTGPGTRAAHGAHTEHGRPRSATSITPFLAVSPAADAIAFYTEHLGARVVDRTDMPGPDGTPQVAK